jgi:hypothetical protein
MTRRERPLHLSDLGAQRIELGADDAIFDEVQAGEPFRGVDRLLRSVHGTPAVAVRAIAFAVARDGVLLALTAGAVLASR